MNKLKLINFIFQRVIGLNHSAKFLVHFTSQVYDGQNISAHPTVHKYLSSAGGCFYHGMNGVELQEGTIISPGVKIVSAAHQEDDYKLLIRDTGYRIIVGKRCWLGSNCVLLPGVTLGDDVIVGAGAVVTKNFPSGSVIAGVPARLLRQKNHEKKGRVLADGCFDPIHEGHIAYLIAAAGQGEFLIVNMAADREIWKKRPQIGPFLPEAIRKTLLENLKPVSKVTVLDTKEALEKERPDIYVKGSDWRGRLPAAEQSICDRLGIKVVFLDTVMNSSSQMLKNFLRQAGGAHYD